MKSSPQHIILCGLPGSGKTTAGKLVAEKTGFPFYDLDQLIEYREKMTVKVLFSLRGEAWFRREERKVLENFLKEKKNDPYVLALGGGTPCFYKNLRSVLHHGILFFLDVPVQTITERLTAQENQRPLLTGNVSEALEKLRDERLPYYTQAHFTIDGTGEAGQVAQAICAQLQ